MKQQSLKVGGLTPLTTIDYPGELAAVIFCQGCPWRCRYCHNSELIPRQGKTQIPWQQIIHFLKQRIRLLDAVVFSGGEPTLQRPLTSAIDEVKALGFKVGLHTAGPYPQRLAALLPKLDWIGLDLKALPESYAQITEVEGSGRRAWESAALLRPSGVPHEIRTTVHPALISADQQRTLIEQLNKLGIHSHRFQACTTQNCHDPQLRD